MGWDETGWNSRPDIANCMVACVQSSGPWLFWDPPRPPERLSTLYEPLLRRFPAPFPDLTLFPVFLLKKNQRQVPSMARIGGLVGFGPFLLVEGRWEATP